mgnify:CR=1 FL=1
MDTKVKPGAVRSISPMTAIPESYIPNSDVEAALPAKNRRTQPSRLGFHARYGHSYFQVETSSAFPSASRSASSRTLLHAGVPDPFPFRLGVEPAEHPKLPAREPLTNRHNKSRQRIGIHPVRPRDLKASLRRRRDILTATNPSTSGWTRSRCHTLSIQQEPFSTGNGFRFFPHDVRTKSSRFGKSSVVASNRASARSASELAGTSVSSSTPGTCRKWYGADILNFWHSNCNYARLWVR